MSTGTRAWFLVIPLCAACEPFTGGRVCTTEARPAIIVDVRDSTSGALAGRGATIVARDGAFADTAFSPAGFDIVPSLAHERPGTYLVTVEQQGYRLWSRSGVRVTKDECHVRTVELLARLQR